MKEDVFAFQVGLLLHYLAAFHHHVKLESMPHVEPIECQQNFLVGGNGRVELVLVVQKAHQLFEREIQFVNLAEVLAGICLAV